MIDEEDIIDSPIIEFAKPRRARKSTIIYLGHFVQRATAVKRSETRKQFQKKIAEGKTLWETGQELGITKPTMYKWMRIFKTDFPKKYKREVYSHNKDFWHQKITEAIKAGLNLRDVDRLLGVGRNNTFNYCKKHNININELRSHAKNG